MMNNVTRRDRDRKTGQPVITRIYFNTCASSQMQDTPVRPAAGNILQEQSDSPKGVSPRGDTASRRHVGTDDWECVGG